MFGELFVSAVTKPFRPDKSSRVEIAGWLLRMHGQQVCPFPLSVLFLIVFLIGGLRVVKNSCAHISTDGRR